ncbi:penicillin-binding protein 2 [Anaerobutyricum soehngenii]|uniref:Penicillin-binding protein 2 n=1 Tax=Anaerobutyricum soehngenii TaxID=105843 RepID=A0ABS3ZLE5_9FIRM|nr:penicillin-binding protein 2 [Anaerobutyricum soehngenii]
MAKKVKKIKRLTDQMRGKLILVFIGIICLFFILAVRLTYWTVNKGSEFETKVLGQQKHDSSVIPFERGKIYDRNGNILATNEKIYTLVLEPKNILLRKKKYEATTINVLHEYFGFSKKNLKKVIEGNKDSYYVVYKKNMTYDEVAKFQKFLDMADDSMKGVSDTKKEKIESARQVKGISFEEDYKRIYPYNSLACRILGFTSSGNVGNWGIEQSYNEQLNGVNGRAYYYFNEELDQEQTVKEAKNGNSVVSTIDMQIQKIIEEKLNDFDSKIGSKVTNILVMDPQNGEILGMASSNPYDLNEPMDEKKLLSLYSQSEIDEMKAYTQEKEAEEASEEESGEESSEETTEQEDKDTEKKKTIYDAFYELWRNAIISDTNEPGSTYKPFTVATGLESGALTGNESYFCTGSLMVGKRNIGCSHVHGNITLKDAVAKSCNVAMMNIAFNEGAETFYNYQNLFGFGRSTGIDLPGEAETKNLVYNASNYSNSVTLATNAFGQNFNCTMMQMAAGFCSLINGGNYYRPHIVKQIQNDGGDVVKDVGKEVLRKTVSEETSASIRSYMQETVENGTGTKAQIEGYTIGGKTGTAEKIPRNKKDYYVSFIGFTPVEKPELLVYVTIDEPNVSFQANAGLAVELEKSCMEEIVNVLGIKAATSTKE